MKIFAVICFVFLLALSGFLVAQDPPQEHPPREGQPEFCTASHKDPKYVCKCLEHDKGKGCASRKDRPGKGRISEEGMSGVCLSHCRISHCHCCAT